MGTRLQTDWLVARPSFLSGVGSTFDLWGTMPIMNSFDSPEEADANAIFSDWAMVGQDISDAVALYSAESETV